LIKAYRSLILKINERTFSDVATTTAAGISEMPRYYFRIAHGRSSGASDIAFNLPDDAAAWHEMTKVCGDLVGGVCWRLDQGSDWQLELLDEAKKPLFRIRLVAESLP
jgi:hypothetical protein